MIDVLTLVITIILTLAAYYFVVYFLLYLFSEIGLFKNRKNISSVKKLFDKFKAIGKYLWDLLLFFILMALASVLAIGLVPIIYKLNAVLGMDYATFASYMIAICLYLIFNQTIQKGGESK